MLDPAARRLLVASAVRLHVARRLGTDPLAGDLVEQAVELDGTAELTRRHGLTFSPSFPGATAGVAATTGGARLVLACSAEHRGEPAAVVVTTLVVGRSPQVTAAPPGTPIPPAWSPIPPAWSPW